MYSSTDAKIQLSQHHQTPDVCTPLVSCDADGCGQRLPHRLHEASKLPVGHQALFLVIVLKELVLLHNIRIACSPALQPFIDGETQHNNHTFALMHRAVKGCLESYSVSAVSACSLALLPLPASLPHVERTGDVQEESAGKRGERLQQKEALGVGKITVLLRMKLRCCGSSKRASYDAFE